ncbi:hypothetical protein M0805_004269 [Coniferiporia weirii]|nr:hypothetical protein M0805_004269 [Coniferiporia weirii]
MISGLSKGVTLYLAPLLSLTALLLSFFAFLAPVFLLQDRVALLSVTPSTTLTNNTFNTDVDGPTIRIGALGKSIYLAHLSDLPSNVPALLTAPTATTPAFIAVSIGFSCLFVVIFTLISFRSKLGPKLGSALDKPFINRTVAWMGLLGFMIGLTAFLVLRMWFGKAVDDFNSGIIALGGEAPQVVASIGNGFTMVWVAYAFHAVPLDSLSGYEAFTRIARSKGRLGMAPTSQITLPARATEQQYNLRQLPVLPVAVLPIGPFKMLALCALALSLTYAGAVLARLSTSTVTGLTHPASPSPVLSNPEPTVSSLVSQSVSLNTHSFTLGSALSSINATPTPSLSRSGSQSGSFIESDSQAASPTLSFTPSVTSVPENGTTTTQSAPDVDPSTLADINTIHERRLPFIVASATQATSISAWLSTLQPNGSWPSSEIDYTSGCSAQRANWPAETHWQRIVTMSSAFHGGLNNAAQWVNSSELRAAISSTMDFWFSNDFTNIACLDSGGLAACPCGTPGFWNPNWFSNIIGIPQLVGESCLLLNSTLLPSQLSNCTNISGRAYATFGRTINDLGTLTGSNTLDVASVGIDLGLLTVNASLIADAYGRVHNEVVIQQALRADGIRPDGSFGQHAGIIYNGNYGKDYTNDVLALEIEAAGTQFEAGTASQEAFATLIDGDQWMIYRNIETDVLHWDFSVLGRFISFPVADNQATASIKINLTEFQVLGETWGSSSLIDAFNNLSQDSTDANVGLLNGIRVFYDNDYMVQRGPGYVSTLRMYSDRTRNTECTNSQNPFGFHLSDGTLYTYMNGSEYEDIAAAWDFNLIPGTTVDYNATPLTCAQTGFAGLEAFVGGASTGSVGVGAMRYTNPLTQALHWQKAWFFLEGGAQHVMVANVSSSTDAPVFSILDQRKHISDIFVDGLAVSSGNFSNSSTLWHGSVGYIFPPGASLTVDVGLRTGDWSALGISTQPPPTIDLFAAWIVHTNLSAPVSYTAFPAMYYPDFLTQAAGTQLFDIQNDAEVSAVLDAATGTAMAIFWSADGGSITIPGISDGDASISLTTDKGLLVILEVKTLTLTVSDPTQTATEVGVTLQLGSGNPPAGWGQGTIKVESITLPASGSAGNSVSLALTG